MIHSSDLKVPTDRDQEGEGRGWVAGARAPLCLVRARTGDHGGERQEEDNMGRWGGRWGLVGAGFILSPTHPDDDPSRSSGIVDNRLVILTPKDGDFSFDRGRLNVINEVFLKLKKKERWRKRDKKELVL